MAQDVARPAGVAPVVTPAAAGDAEAGLRLAFAEYVSARVEDRDARESYLQAVHRFLIWVGPTGLALPEIRPVHVEGYVELFGGGSPALTPVRLLAAIRMLFDYLVENGAVGANPAGPEPGAADRAG